MASNRKHQPKSARVNAPQVAPKPQLTVNQWLRENSHGYVEPLADGSKVKCGGLQFCSTCQAEKLIREMLITHTKLKAEIQAAKLLRYY